MCQLQHLVNYGRISRQDLYYGALSWALNIVKSKIQFDKL